MIEIRNIYKRFGKTHVLNDVSMRYSAGQCIALIGPNGCGKTTLIKSILGMVLPQSGTILVNGINIKQGEAYRNHIGYMPQIGRYPENMTISQIMDMMTLMRAETQTYDRELYEAFHIESLGTKTMRTLSGGTVQKVSATLAFLFNPDILILDEPTAGLDPIAAEILKQKIIKERKKGKLIIITSHILSELDELITDISFMQEGKIVFTQSAESLKQQTRQTQLNHAITHLLKQATHG